MFNIDATFYTNADFKLVWFWEMLGNCHHLFTCENLSDDEYLDLLFTGALIKYPDHDRFLFSHYFKKLRYYLIAELDKLKLMYATFDVTARVVFDDKNRKTWYFVEYFIDHRSA